MRRNGEESNHYFSVHPNSQMKVGILSATFRGRFFKFYTTPGVFSKSRIDLGTRLLIESMAFRKEQGYLVDIGCGYGPVGIAAAAFYPKLRVIMVDVNERAIWLAHRNVKLNCVKNVEVRQGDLYDPVKGILFDYVLSNPPISAGLKTITAIITEAPKHMAATAQLRMVVKSKIGGKRLLTIFERTFGNVNVYARKSGYRVLIAEKQ